MAAHLPIAGASNTAIGSELVDYAESDVNFIFITGYVLDEPRQFKTGKEGSSMASVPLLMRQQGANATARIVVHTSPFCTSCWLEAPSKRNRFPAWFDKPANMASNAIHHPRAQVEFADSVP